MGKKILNLIGRQFGKFTVIHKADDYIKPNKKHVVMWHCRCKCGSEYDISEDNLISGPTGICTCNWNNFTPSNFNDLTGKKFGRLTVIKRAKNSNNSTMWECVCDCGNTTIVSSSALVSGNTKSCGCYNIDMASSNFKDIANIRFGRLVALERYDFDKNAIRKGVMWRCKCDCGNVVDVTYNNLVNGNTQSCGCLRKELATELFLDDLTGQKFGNLTVIRRSEDYISPSGNHQTQWECQCDCGNIKIVNANSLKYGYTKSCGCLSYSNGEEIISKILEDNDVIFERQKIFDNCRFPNTGRMAKFDFYVNNQYIIEYDGEQHFRPVAFNGSNNTQKTFHITRTRDLFKNKYCFDQKIPIIRIPYTHLKNICLDDLILMTTKFILNKQNEFEYYIKYGGQMSINRIKELINLLNKASTAYYNSGNAIMSDEEFDLLIEELKSLEKQTGLILSNSPTQTVGAEVKTNLTKIKHIRPMLSLDKCHSAQELVDFAENDDCYLSVKCDGLTTRLVYENGELVGAETRGNGEIGQDVLFHIKEYINVPTHIPVTSRYVIDGESVIFYTDFSAINNTLPENERFANPRNLASGTLSNLDANITRQRNMRFIAWRVIEGDDDDSHFFRLKNAEKVGFTVTPMWTYTNKSDDPDHLEDMLHNLRKQANDMGLPMDGIVMAKNSHAKAESMGRTAKFFRHSIAYKFEDEEYETKLSGVEFTMGKSGSLTPTATFKSVDIDGTTVERASLANLSIIKKLGLTNNCTVFVRKANCIIPQITRALQDGNGEIEIPSTCPICSGKTAIIKENESEVLVCTNPECSGKLLGKLKFFVSKPAANIDGLSKATLVFLIDRGWVKSFRDIYHLDDYKNEWQKCDGFGKKSVEKILSAIEKSRNIDLAHFICSLSIPNIGLSASKTISQYCDGSYDKFYQLFEQGFDWTNFDDFGPTMAQNLDSYLDEWWREVNELSKEMRFTVSEKNSDNSLNGLKFCITGSFSQSRDELKKRLEAKGAKFVSSVSKNLNVLFAGDKAGSKLTKAQQLGIRVAGEDELMKMLGE